MSASIDNIAVLPNMSHPREKGRVFRLLWVLGLVSNYSKCFVTLVFQHTNSKYILVDMIPPELLSYCTLGTYYSEGRKWNNRRPDGTSLSFTINSDKNNSIMHASDAFLDKEYDLSLAGRFPDISNALKNQQCFVQQVNGIKVVIPCFVLATAYYFKSTSLRESVVSRKIESLFHHCTLEHETRHAEIYLKPSGNIGDAKNIARFVYDEFARNRINVCNDHLYTHRELSHKPIKVDFPVNQKIDIKARGLQTVGGDGSKTFIVFQFESENSSYPFDTIEIKHDIPEARESNEEPFKSGNPKKNPKSGKRMNTNPPSDNYVRQLLESSDHIENQIAEAIEETKTAIKKPPEGEKKAIYEKSDEEVELSTQPGTTKDTNTASATIREKDNHERKKLAASLDNFIFLANSLRDYSFTIKSGEKEVTGQITNYKYTDDFVYRRSDVGQLSLKESYDHSQANRRKCAYVTFSCQGKYVCLVEIDQTGMSGSGLSTMVLISNTEINTASAKYVVEGFVRLVNLADRAKELKKKNILLETKNHPSVYNEETQKSWRAKLIEIILGIKHSKTEAQ